MKKWISLMLTLVLLCAAAMPLSLAEETISGTLLFPYIEEVESFVSESLTLYYRNMENTHDFQVYFVNGEHGIPYIEAETAADILSYVYKDCEGYQDYSISIDHGENSIILTRDNDSLCIWSLDDNQIIFDNYDLFGRAPNAANLLDLAEIGAKTADDPAYLLQRKTFNSRSGSVSYFNLDKYCIKLLELDGNICMPLQTFNDLIFCSIGYSMVYNGKVVMVCEIQSLTDFSSDFYKLYTDVEPAQKSEAMTQFTYNELCLALDSNYGLMEEHHIDSFDRLFIETSSAKYLYSNEPGDTFIGLSQVILNYLADKHSSALARSPLAKAWDNQEAIDASINNFTKNLDTLISMSRYQEPRAAAYPDGIKGYEEVDNTAFITFDTFFYDAKRDYYADAENGKIGNNEADTIELLLYAHQQINREDSPIENVVIDLTNNGGGALDTAVAVVSWFLGECKLSIRDVKNNASSTTTYTFDANLDRVFDNNTDNVKNLKRYCLISPNSFSCGNLVPNAFKRSDAVTLIGRTSGGGTCSVQMLSTADGSLFCCSSRYQITNVVNGSNYSVDTGATPDIYVKDIENLYDRQWIVDLINE